MRGFIRVLCLLCITVTLGQAEGVGVPVLLYHRFGPVKTDSMTVTTPVFGAHLAFLRDRGYRVVPLKQIVDWIDGKGSEPPAKAVAIVVDDGHKTVYADMLPLVKQHKIPVTLFVYPSAISNAPYAMTWAQLKELKQTGLFDIQSHTYWHPHFGKEKRKMKAGEFERFADMQFAKSKIRIEKEVGGTVDMLAWPFGIADEYLADRAAKAGYRAAFTIKRRHVSKGAHRMMLPRYIIVDADRGRIFEQILRGEAPHRAVAY